MNWAIWVWPMMRGLEKPAEVKPTFRNTGTGAPFPGVARSEGQMLLSPLVSNRRLQDE